MLPPLGLVKVKRYQGQTPGDIIDLKFNIPFMGHWVVIIKDSFLSHREYSFTDRGLKVPFGIKYWKHNHRVVARNNNSCFIIDDIEFETSFVITDRLLYLPLFFMFYMRKPQYRSYYKKLGESV